MAATSQLARATDPDFAVVAAILGVREPVPVMVTAVLATLVSDTSSHERPGQTPAQGRTPAVSTHAPHYADPGPCAIPSRAATTARRADDRKRPLTDGPLPDRLWAAWPGRGEHALRQPTVAGCRHGPQSPSNLASAQPGTLAVVANTNGPLDRPAALSLPRLRQRTRQGRGLRGLRR